MARYRVRRFIVGGVVVAAGALATAQESDTPCFTWTSGPCCSSALINPVTPSTGCPRVFTSNPQWTQCVQTTNTGWVRCIAAGNPTSICMWNEMGGVDCLTVIGTGSFTCNNTVPDASSAPCTVGTGGT